MKASVPFESVWLLQCFLSKRMHKKQKQQYTINLMHITECTNVPKCLCFFHDTWILFPQTLTLPFHHNLTLSLELSLSHFSGQEQSTSSRLPGGRPQPGSSQDCTQTETLLITSKTISKTLQKSRTRDKHKNKENDRFHDAWIHPTARLNSKTAWKSTPN